ncbi:hypothetical protein QQF64_033427 [Cirrhinus molitorella]|uniref:Uncharacterized protein n=1 Tax=Cirrhinus molitorella TaxID=172907 RepID=A0ABR3MTW6_9TELE
MEQRRPRRRRALPTHLRGFLVEGVSSIQEASASVSSEDECPVPLYQQEEPVSIHGCSVQGYQDIYRSVEPMIKTRCGRQRPYSLELGLKMKQRLWEKLNCPSLLETEQPDGRILITESFTTSRSFAPRIHVDVSEEPLPEEPRRKKPRH